MIWFVVSGVFYLVFGMVLEFSVRPKPMVPASYVPGFLFLCAGAGFCAALFDRYFPRFGTIVFFLPAVLIFFFQTIGHNSILPLMLYSGLFQLLRALLRVTIPTDGE